MTAENQNEQQMTAAATPDTHAQPKALPPKQQAKQKNNQAIPSSVATTPANVFSNLTRKQVMLVVLGLVAVVAVAGATAAAIVSSSRAKGDDSGDDGDDGDDDGGDNDEPLVTCSPQFGDPIESDCEHVLTSVWVNDNTKENLATSQIVKVSGNVEIANTTSLTSIPKVMFGNLTEIGGSLTISHNEFLVEVIDGFPYLEKIESGVVMESNERLEKVSTVAKPLKKLGSLLVKNNEKLQTFSIGEDGANEVEITGDFVFDDNADLESLQSGGLRPKEIGGDLSLVNCPKLSSLLFFSTDIRSVGGNLEFNGLTTVAEIDGFNELVSVGANINIEKMGNADTINGFNSLDFVGGSITIQDNNEGTSNYPNDGLTTISGFDTLEEIDGSVKIVGNKILQSVDAFVNLKHCNGDVIIADNFEGSTGSLSEFTTLTGLGANLTEVKGSLTVSKQSSLLTIPTFSKLTSVGKHLEFVDNDDLQPGEGNPSDYGDWFRELTQVGGQLKIEELSTITKSPAFSNLQSVGESLIFKGNSEMVTIVDLSALESVGMTLTFEDNGKLLDIPEMPSLTSANGIRIVENSVVTELQADLFKDITHLAGDLIIEGNSIDSIGSNVFSSLETIGGNLEFREDQLTTLAIFPLLTQIDGDLVIMNDGYPSSYSGTPKMESITGFQALESVKGQLKLESLIYLNTVTGFSLEEVQGGIIIDDLEQMTQLEFLETIKGTVNGDIDIKNMDALTKLSLPEVEHVEGGVLISLSENIDTFDMAKLTNIGKALSWLCSSPSFDQIQTIAFPELKHVGTDLTISECENLDTLEFPKLEKIGGNLVLDTLENLGALSFSSLIGIGHGLELDMLTALATLEFPQLVHIGFNFEDASTFDKSISVECSSSFSTSCALQQLKFPLLKNVTTGVEIQDQDSLTTLEFPELESVIDGGFTLRDLQVLDSVAISQLYEVTGDFTLQNLQALDTVTLSQLYEVNGDFTVENLQALETVAISQLHQVDGDFTLKELPALNNADFSMLNQIDKLSLEKVAGPDTMEFQALTSVESIEVDCGFSSSGCNSPGTISFPVLKKVTGAVTFESLTDLETLDFPVLEVLEDNFALKDLESLSTLAIPELIGVGKEISIDGVAGPLLFTNLVHIGFNLDYVYSSTKSIEVACGNSPCALQELKFPLLKNVTAGVEIKDQDSLTTLEFPELELVIDGDFTLQNMPALETIDLSKLKQIDDTLMVSIESSSLQQLNLPSLTETGTDLVLDATLDGLYLPVLHQVGGSLRLLEGASLPSLELPQLQKVSTRIELLGSLESLHLPALEEIDDDFIIASNVNLTSLELPELKTIGYEFSVKNQQHLEYITANVLESVGDNFILQETGIYHLDGFPSLTSVGGNFEIVNNHRLEEVLESAFPTLHTITDELKFSENSVLVNVTSFQSAESIGSTGLFGDGIVFTDMPQLETIGGFSMLETSGKLHIINCGPVQLLQGFASLVDFDENCDFTDSTVTNPHPTC